jgi:hypothetical protein
VMSSRLPIGVATRYSVEGVNGGNCGVASMLELNRIFRRKENHYCPVICFHAFWSDLVGFTLILSDLVRFPHQVGAVAATSWL